MGSLLPALAGAQALGILFADRVEPSAPLAWATAGLLALAALALRRPTHRSLAWIAAAFATGAASLAGPLAAARDAAPLPAEALVEATAERVAWQGDRVRVDWAAARAVGDGPVPPRLRTWNELEPRFPAELQTPLPGERWRQRLRLRRPEAPRNPGGLDPTRGLARRGIGATARRAHPALAVRVGADGEGARRRLALARRRRSERLAAIGPGGALLAALGLGERGALAEDVRRAFARLGLAHLLAVSGLHLALVAGAAFAIAGIALARVPGLAARHDVRRAAAGVALAAAFAYAAASGFAIPVARALVLLAAAGLALALRRPRGRAAPLALASFVLLAHAPHALFEAGFQLSFAATAALLFSRPADDGPTRVADGAWGRAARALRRALEGLVRTSASALLATAPIVAFHFGAGPPVGLVANLVAIPATAFVLLPAAGVAVLAAGHDGGAARAVVALAAAPAAGALSAVSAAAHALPAAVGAAARQASAPALALGGALAAVGVRCAATRARVAVLVLQAAWLAWVPPAPIVPAPPRLVALDVGQGDAIVVQGRRGVLVVDAGRRLPSGHDLGERVVAPSLAALGVERIDRLAVTHADLDHRGGAPALVERFRVGAIWLPRGSGGDPAFDALRAVAARRGVAILERGRGDPAEPVGDLRVAFLWPPPTPPRESRNDRSLVLRVVAPGGAAALLPGDVGEPSERALVEAHAPLASDVLLLPHHGSRTSSSAAFLAAVAPRLAVVSAPCLGRFPMPDPAVRARLAGRGAPLRWTGRDGAVIVGLSPRLELAPAAEPRVGCFGTTPSGRSRPGIHEARGESR
ncbi:MAG TPA: DNA internalization-related competence protein ComEC/Rec2 [Myxococcota bacterium]|nr:DNA internalization-related competence protein ComEC/Rec2 [Myxococcota bacterium]